MQSETLHTSNRRKLHRHLHRWNETQSMSLTLLNDSFSDGLSYARNHKEKHEIKRAVETQGLNALGMLWTAARLWHRVVFLRYDAPARLLSPAWFCPSAPLAVLPAAARCLWRRTGSRSGKPASGRAPDPEPLYLSSRRKAHGSGDFSEGNEANVQLLKCKRYWNLSQKTLKVSEHNNISP